MNAINLNINDKYKFLNASALKLIAIVTMLIDHLAAGILICMIREGYSLFSLTPQQLIPIYSAMRHIGRQAFPIYCFLIAEGLTHTRNVYKYMLNLGIFGIISEPFFDYAVKVRNAPFSTDLKFVFELNKEKFLNDNNVYFTLLIGLVVIYIMKLMEEKLFYENPASITGYTAIKPVYNLLYALPLAMGCALSYLLGTDYDAWGVGLIAVFYTFRKCPVLASFVGYLFFITMYSESWSLPAFILVLFYNGKQGRSSKRFKYAYYAFYPVHLLIIYLVRVYLI